MDADRPAWTLGRRREPTELSTDRARRWCVLRTQRDADPARRNHRPIAPHHLARLFARRWRDLSEQLGGFDRQQYLRKLHGRRDLLGKGKT
jgi:hypothetical protein